MHQNIVIKNCANIETHTLADIYEIQALDEGKNNFFTGTTSTGTSTLQTLTCPCTSTQ